MEKIIKVTSCKDCPYLQEATDDNGLGTINTDYYCGKLNEDIGSSWFYYDISNYANELGRGDWDYSIPEQCPLEVAEEDES